MFRNSSYYFAALLLASLAAFWPKYLSKPASSIDAYTHVHAFAMLAWCGLLIAQPLLIRSERRRMHRALGAVSYALVPVLLVASLLLAHARFRAMDDATFETESPSLFLPLSAILLFALSYGLAVIFRRTPALHARFMICTALTMIDPVVGRLLFFYLPPLPNDLYYQAITFGAVDLILLSLAFRDRGNVEVRGVFAGMLVPFVAAHVFWFTAARAEGWREFAAWFRSLTIT